MIEQFYKDYRGIKIRCIIADALYGENGFVGKAKELYKVQIISQIRSNQNIVFRNKKKSVDNFFKIYYGVPQEIKIRGRKEETITMSSARLYLEAHQEKRFIIAFKYEGEKDYRYLVATDLSWRAVDIIQAYTLRWLVEVFFEDWKSNEGWGKLAKQPDEEGSRRGLILSLVVDHCLLFHPDQSARLENKLSAFTVGTLRDKVIASCLFEFVNELLISENPKQKLNYFAKNFEKIFPLKESKKHMSDVNMGILEPAKSLKHKNQLLLKM